MPWDDQRVRIELGIGMAMVTRQRDGKQANDMESRQTAEVWLCDPETGKVRRGKPVLRLAEADRPALLRGLADWIEQNDDPGLTKLVAEFAEKTA